MYSSFPTPGRLGLSSRWPVGLPPHAPFLPRRHDLHPPMPLVPKCRGGRLRYGVVCPEKEKTKRLVPFGIAQELRIELFSDTGAFPVKVARRQCDVPSVRPRHEAGVAAVQQRTRGSVSRQLQTWQDAGGRQNRPLGGRFRPRSLRKTCSHASGQVSHGARH